MSTTNATGAGVLTEAETIQLLTRAIEGSPDGRMAEDDLVRIGQWASETKTTLLEMEVSSSKFSQSERGHSIWAARVSYFSIVPGKEESRKRAFSGPP